MISENGMDIRRLCRRGGAVQLSFSSAPFACDCGYQPVALFFWLTAAIYIGATLLIREKPLVYSGNRSEYEFWRRNQRDYWRRS